LDTGQIYADSLADSGNEINPSLSKINVAMSWGVNQSDFQLASPPISPLSMPSLSPHPAAITPSAESVRKVSFEPKEQTFGEKVIVTEQTVEHQEVPKVDTRIESEAVPIADQKPAHVSTTAPAPAIDSKYEKYLKMKKMLPEGAVRQKMTVDGFSPQEIDKLMGGELELLMQTAVSTSPPQAVVTLDPRYEKYTKMRKMLPEGAVRQKMTADGFTPDEIDKFFLDPGTAAVPAPSEAVAEPAPLDPKFDKFVKMRKMLPEGSNRSFDNHFNCA
jgi:hypothetical protein